ncbi:GspE/PulE family protein [Desulfocurvibacter africanus]|uniref:Type II secretion system protein E n=1 Tax=Desulfocurvibacter africanus subsp. africanus str. Walvis Bay TaxID=690850 RepID=F3YUZ0_DESAF|nr:GspE/PulE family protein [Desulfocurvibacter africanus]EGJ49240.1 type II secretion system protein E [Desulfocurvibacter africanus subsp. africanus str. Walvis Bay]
MRRKARLGEMLVQSGLLDKATLEKALQDKARGKRKLGEYLVANGICREGDIIGCISRQMGIEKYHPSRFPVDVSLSGHIPADMARQLKLAPLSLNGRLLLLAMVDPLDIEAMDSAEFASKCEVDPVICSEQELNQLHSTIYGLYSGLGDVLDGMEELRLEGSGDEDRTVPQLDLKTRDDQADVPAVKLVNSILMQAVQERASDVHISPEKERMQVRFRIDGKLQEVPAPPKRFLAPMLSRIKLLAGMDIAVTRAPQDGRFSAVMDTREINIRASCMPTIHGENMVLRLLDTSSGGYDLEQLGMLGEDQDRLKAACARPHGLILVAGPTGSGKTTTLYAMLRLINTPEANVITLEDPVEYRIAGIRQVQLNRKAGMTFASGLRSILRQDPDVIMVGEIRDAETAAIAVQAALTGHRVLSSVHTNDASGAITRLLDMGIEPFLVSSVLLAAVGQRLLRRVCPSCAEEYDPGRTALRQLGMEDDKKAIFRRGRGCTQCMQTGYRGRVGIYEILMADQQVQEMILRKASAGEISRAMTAAGKLRTLRQDAMDKVRRGETTIEEALSAVMF